MELFEQLFDYSLIQWMSIIILFLIIVSVIIYALYIIFRNPFEYPYFIKNFDVTNKRNIKIEDYIDNYLMDYKNWQLLEKHQNQILKWKKDTEEKVQNSFLKKYRENQFNKIIDDKNAYRFLTIRKQTRYKQSNYVKTAYKVNNLEGEWAASWGWIKRRYKMLEDIGFESTLNDYNSKSQRNLMKPELRQKIKERDNYTCQLCGKHMPDEVGLHIDHIIPVSKGGKSVPSNLRVLCSKCNGKKGAKTQ